MFIRRHQRNNGVALIYMTVLLVGITAVQTTIHWNDLKSQHIVLLVASAVGLIVVGMMAFGWLMFGRARAAAEEQQWAYDRETIEAEIIEGETVESGSSQREGR